MLPFNLGLAKTTYARPDFYEILLEASMESLILILELLRSLLKLLKK
jgi:hypothetical protein